MTSGYIRPYLDANVYITAITGPGVEDPSRVDTAAKILKSAEDGRLQIIASTLIIAEVVRDKPTTSGGPGVFDQFILHRFMSWVEMDFNLARKARSLAQTYGFKGADAVHVASAIRGGADTFLTWDDKVLNRFPNPDGIEGLRAELPYVVQPPQLALDL